MNHQHRRFNLFCLAMLLALVACQGQATPASQTEAPSLSVTPPPTVTIEPSPIVEPSHTPNPFPNPTLKVTGDIEVVFDWSKDRCEALDIPDLPARAFRDEQGNVQLINSHYINRRFIGPDLNHIKHDCEPIMQSASNPDPSMYSYHQWLAAPYTEDGTTIYALVHNEYYGSNAYVPCKTAYDGDPSCNFTSITLAISNDGGASYQAAVLPPANLIASAPYAFEAGVGPYGFFEPSNIIKGADGYYYFYAREHFYRQGGNVAAVCLIRTNNLRDASSWRAWDGKDFTVTFINPYLEPDKAKSASQCAAIPENNLGLMHQSITFNTYLNRYVMVGVSQLYSTAGIFYSFSDDLINWSGRRLLAELKLQWSIKPGDNDYYYLYPSLLDPDSPSRNFETTGKTAYLYLTRFNRYKNGTGDPLDRDLVRFPVEFFPKEDVGPLESNALEWEFENAADAEGWTPWNNQLIPFQIANGHLTTQSTGSSAWMGSSRFAVDAMALTIIRINLKVSAGGWAQLFFTTDTDETMNEAKKLRFPLQADGQFHEYVLDMSKVPGWNGAITQLQLQLEPAQTPASVELDYIRIGTP